MDRKLQKIELKNRTELKIDIKIESLKRCLTGIEIYKNLSYSFFIYTLNFAKIILKQMKKNSVKFLIEFIKCLKRDAKSGLNL